MIRVASVPASHVYVRHLSDPDGTDDVVRLPDVRPPNGEKVPGGWWPPLMLDADWVREHRDAFDVFHVHFGFDALSPEQLRTVVDALNAENRPLVVTVHDLANPHHADQRRHEAQLRALLDGAAEVITLTEPAAALIHDRFGRDAVVLPHPHVLEPPHLRDVPRREPRDELIVGLHAKSLRANMDAVAVAEALAGRPGTRLQINIHNEVFEPGSYWHDLGTGEALRALAASRPRTSLHEHEYFSDAELWAYLGSIDVSVLPYRFGSHSGWLEACHDLGTTVVAPTCGFYAAQRPCLQYTHDERGLDAASLRAAVDAARDRHPVAQATLEDRLAERRRVAAEHARIYRRALA